MVTFFLLKSDICDPLMTNSFPVTYTDLTDSTISVVFRDKYDRRRLFICITENIFAPAMLVIGRHSLTQQQLQREPSLVSVRKFCFTEEPKEAKRCPL